MSHNLVIAERDNFAYKHIVFPAKPIIYKEDFKDIINTTKTKNEELYKTNENARKKNPLIFEEKEGAGFTLDPKIYKMMSENPNLFYKPAFKFFF